MNEKIENLRKKAYRLENEEKWDKLIPVATKLTELEKEYHYQAIAYCTRGSAYLYRGEYDRALEDFNKVIELNPKHADAYLSRGIAYSCKGNDDRSIADFTKTLGLNLKYVEAYYGRGIAYINKKDYNRAIANFTKTIELTPEYVDAYHNRGVAYIYKKDYDLAIADFTKAIELNSKHTDAYYNLGIAYRCKGKYSLSIADFTKAIELNPKHADAYLNRGIAYGLKDNNNRAIADFTKAVELNCEHVYAAYGGRGIAYIYKKDYDRAIENFNMAIELNPKYIDAYYDRGTTYIDKKNYDRAIENFNITIKLNSEHAKAYDMRGLSYGFKGNNDRAFEDFNIAAAKDPTLKIRDSLVYIASQISAIDGLERNQQTDAFEIYINLWDKVSAIKDKLFYSPEKSKHEVSHYTSFYKVLGSGLIGGNMHKSGVAHYTSRHVLKNLSKAENRFRLYNANYMNDPEEGKIFFKIMNKYKIDIEEWFYKDEDKSYRSPAYIGSFVRLEEENEQKDKLFLWRTYGKHNNEEAAGACLIFNDKRCFAKYPTHQFGFMREQSDNMQEDLAFYKIHYQRESKNYELEKELRDLGSQLNHINKFIEEVHAEKIKSLWQKIVPKQEIEYSLRRLVCELLDSIRFLFKDKHYCEEEEVRIIQLRYSEKSESSESQSEVDMENIPPRFYLEAPKNFQFSEVILGPRTERYQEWEQWLKTKAKEQGKIIDIKKSEIPYGK